MNEPKSPSNLQLFAHYLRPWSLLAGILTYFLGSGIAKYLGHGVQYDRLWAGMLLVVLLLLASYTLKLYYDLVEASGPLMRMSKTADEFDHAAFERLSRPAVLLAAFTLLTAVAALTVVLFAEGAIEPAGMFILVVAFILAFFYGVPPLRLTNRGYGELTEAILIASFSPVWAFILQTGELHRLLYMLTFPLLVLFMAMRLAQSLEYYARDFKLVRRTMMIVIGWQRGMQFHNLLILAGYFLLALAAAFGLPWPLTWPALLSLPVGIFQIYLMSQIAAGAKPSWRLLRLASAATFALTAYLIAFAVWTG
jgi:1,4-dihydroxy-2-naphthoate polyprenyltransferase